MTTNERLAQIMVTHEMALLEGNKIQIQPMLNDEDLLFVCENKDLIIATIELRDARSSEELEKDLRRKLQNEYDRIAYEKARLFDRGETEKAVQYPMHSQLSNELEAKIKALN